MPSLSCMIRHEHKQRDAMRCDSSAVACQVITKALQILERHWIFMPLMHCTIMLSPAVPSECIILVHHNDVLS